jgi:hypothetical protein
LRAQDRYRDQRRRHRCHRRGYNGADASDNELVAGVFLTPARTFLVPKVDLFVVVALLFKL